MTDLSAFFPLFGKDEDTIYAEMVARANAGLSADDPGWVDTRVGSPFYVDNWPFAIQLAAAYTRMNEAAAAGIMATSWSTYLDLHAESLGTARKAATQATGAVVFTGSAGTLIGVGTRELPPQTDPDQNPPAFETTGSGTIPAALAAPAGPSATLGAVGGTLTASTLYRYVVTALDLAGETVVSAEVNATTDTTHKQITVAWTAVAGASGYGVYRKTGATGPPYDFLVTVAAPTVNYNDNGGVATNGAVHPPTVNGTGGKLSLPVVALDAGSGGDVAQNQVTLLDSNVSGVASLTNPAAMSGGFDEETDLALKTRLEILITGAKGANVAWYMARALEEPGVGMATVTPVWSGGGTVLVVVMTAAGRAVPAATVTSLQARLDPVSGQGAGQAPIDHAVTVQTPAEILIDVKGTPSFKPGYSLDGASGTIAQRAVILSAIQGYLNTLRAGDDVIYDAVKAAYFKAPGVLDVTAVQTAIHAGSFGTADIAIANSGPAQVAVYNDLQFV